jgi:hypothetical protein
MVGGLGLIVFRKDEAATFLAIGTGFVTGGVMARKTLGNLYYVVRWRGLVPLSIGLGGGFFVGSLAELLLDRGNDAPPLLGVGTGLVLGAYLSNRMFPVTSVGWRRRVFLALLQGVGCLLLAIGATHAFFSRGSDAPILMGIGSGMLVAGFFVYRMLLRAEGKQMPSTDGGRETSVGVVVAQEVEHV